MSSPDSQNIPWSSQLKAMERPVRSFRSFISIVPPNPRPELYKPLPPTPELTPKSCTFPSTVSDIPSNSTPWTAAEVLEWKNSSAYGQRSLSLPLLSDHEYSSPSRNLASKVDKREKSLITRTQKPRNVRPTQLKLDQGRFYARTSLRSHSPAKNLRPQSPCACAERCIGMRSWLSEHEKPASSFTILQPTVYRGEHSNQSPQTATVPSLDSDDSTSDSDRKSLAWSCIGSPRTTKFDWGEVQNVATVMEAKTDGHERRRRFPIRRHLSNRNGFILVDGPQERELAKKLEQLGLAEDVQELCVDQYHTSDTPYQKPHCPRISPTDIIKHAYSAHLGKHSRDHLLAPLPYTLGKRKSNSSFSCSTSVRLESDAKLNFESKRRHKMRPLKIKSSVEDIDGARTKEVRLPNILVRTRSFTFSKKRANLEKARYKRHSASAPSLSPSPIPPCEQPVIMPSTPGGFATVRKPPLDLPPLQISDAHNGFSQTRLLHEYSPMSPSTEPPVSSSGTFHLKSSLSQRSLAQVKPMLSVKREVCSSIILPPSPDIRFGNPVPPSSPLAHEIPLPPTPTLPTPSTPERRVRSSRSFNCGSPIFKRQGECAEEHEKQIQKILDKAKYAQGTWKRRQQEIRRQKLKQSIRVVGPADLAAAVWYA